MSQKLRKVAVGYLLLLIARVLSWVLFPIGRMYILYRTVFHYKTSTPLGYFAYSSIAKAYAIDCKANVICGPLFNEWFITKDSTIFFGNIDHSISLILGYNTKAGTLSKSGWVLYYFLDLVDTGHCEKVVINYENRTLKTTKYFY
jgi:hypothetical protein